MIPILATSSLTGSPISFTWAEPTPRITTPANVSNLPWLYSALTQVRDIEADGELIPGLGDFRVAEQTAMRARMLLSSIEITSLPSPVVSPVSGGGLSISWSLGPKEVKLSFDPSGETLYFTISDDEILDDGAVDVKAQTPISEHLQWMLDRRT